VNLVFEGHNVTIRERRCAASASRRSRMLLLPYPE
jgi:hypothetical protein